VKRTIVFLMLAAVAVLAVLAHELDARWRTPLHIPQQGLQFEVTTGDSLRTVTDRLHAQGVLSYPLLSRLYGRWTGLDEQIKRGEYALQPGTTARALLQQLYEGKVIQYQVTLPEGITLARALEILAHTPNLQADITGPDDPRIIKMIAPHQVAEGLIFPESYYFAAGSSDWSLVQRAHRDMMITLQREWQQRAPGLPYETPYEALIMASIIERETGLPEERRQIAGVFVRRLLAGMRLQTDPTVIYGLGPDFDGNLRRRHLRDESNRYNTYRHGGLPPSPIALPGLASIQAALHPEQGDTLYFVARGDGGHIFSKTLAEHEAAVRKYQLNRRADYRSSPETGNE